MTNRKYYGIAGLGVELNMKRGKTKDGKTFKYAASRLFRYNEELRHKCILCNKHVDKIRYVLSTDEGSQEDETICQQCYETLSYFVGIYDLNKDLKRWRK